MLAWDSWRKLGSLSPNGTCTRSGTRWLELLRMVRGKMDVSNPEQPSYTVSLYSLRCMQRFAWWLSTNQLDHRYWSWQSLLSCNRLYARTECRKSAETAMWRYNLLARTLLDQKLCHSGQKYQWMVAWLQQWHQQVYCIQTSTSSAGRSLNRKPTPSGRPPR